RGADRCARRGEPPARRHLVRSVQRRRAGLAAARAPVRAGLRPGHCRRGHRRRRVLAAPEQMAPRRPPARGRAAIGPQRGRAAAPRDRRPRDRVCAPAVVASAGGVSAVPEAPLRILDADAIAAALTYPALVEALREAFRADIAVPVRHHHTLPQAGRDATLLLMPAWTGAGAANERFLGCKIVTVFPDNAATGQPSLHGRYLL